MALTKGLHFQDLHLHFSYGTPSPDGTKVGLAATVATNTLTVTGTEYEILAFNPARTTQIGALRKTAYVVGGVQQYEGTSRNSW